MNTDTIQIALIGVVGTVVLINTVAPLIRRAMTARNGDKPTVQVTQHQGDAVNTGRHAAIDTITPRECEARHEGIEHRIESLENGVSEMRTDIQSTRDIAKQILDKVS